MRKSHKILTAVAVAGIVFAGGSAFTGTGLTNTADNTQFIGGEVQQLVTGATLATVDYDFTDTTQKTIDQINLTFTDTEDGQPVAVIANGDPAGEFTCGDTLDNKSTCTLVAGYTGLSALSITVGTLDAAPAL